MSTIFLRVLLRHFYEKKKTVLESIILKKYLLKVFEIILGWILVFLSNRTIKSQSQAVFEHVQIYLPDDSDTQRGSMPR